MTTGDSSGRTIVDVYVYTVDATVGTHPNLTISGALVNVGGENWVSPTAAIALSNLNDDITGIGISHVECHNGSSAWTQVSSTTFNLNSVTGDEVLFAVECRIVDLLGNEGESVWLNGTVDSRLP